MPMVMTGKQWSRAVTAEPLSNDGRPCSVQSFSDDSSACTTGGCAASGALVLPKREFHELLAASIRGSVFAVTITSLSTEDSSHFVHAVSRGAEELYEWPRSFLLGEGSRLLEVQDAKTELENEAKVRTAHIHGAEATVFQTQRKASGELFKAWQYKRGMSFGTDPITGDELWYLLTISFDVTTEFERERSGDRSVDYDFYQESALSIATQVKSKISSAISDRLSDRAMWGEEFKCGTRHGDNMASEDDVKALHVSTPGWVACPAASKMLLTCV